MNPFNQVLNRANLKSDLWDSSGFEHAKLLNKQSRFPTSSLASILRWRETHSQSMGSALALLDWHKQLIYYLPFDEKLSTGKTILQHTGDRLAKRRRALWERNRPRGSQPGNSSTRLGGGGGRRAGASIRMERFPDV